MAKKRSNQNTGNVGLYFVCYQLAKRGWNVMPTARNAKGVDVVIYSDDGKRMHTVQVKALSKRSPVPLGKSLDGIYADFLIVCYKVDTDQPVCFVLLPGEVKELAHRGEKDERVSYWLQPPVYDKPKFREQWDRIA